MESAPGQVREIHCALGQKKRYGVSVPAIPVPASAARCRRKSVRLAILAQHAARLRPHAAVIRIGFEKQEQLVQALDAARRRQRVAREPGEEGELARAEPGSVLPPEALERGERRGRCRSSHGSILAGPLRYSTFMHRMIPAAALLAILAVSPRAEPADAGMDAAAAGRFAHLALACIQREYPNKIAHVLDGDADVQPPRSLTPVFYGCFDWHSSVHGHWLLARLAREYPDAEFAAPARAALAISFTEGKVAQEVAYLQGEGRASFERPYGLAWLLQLTAELRSWNDADAQRWAKVLQPLEAEAANRIRTWLPKLHYPIRVGEHSQTAFAFGLIRDWSIVSGDAAMRDLIDERSRSYYLARRQLPARLRAVRRGFPLALPRGSGPDAARAAA